MRGRTYRLTSDTSFARLAADGLVAASKSPRDPLDSESVSGAWFAPCFSMSTPRAVERRRIVGSLTVSRRVLVDGFRNLPAARLRLPRCPLKVKSIAEHHNRIRPLVQASRDREPVPSPVQRIKRRNDPLVAKCRSLAMPYGVARVRCALIPVRHVWVRAGSSPLARPLREGSWSHPCSTGSSGARSAITLRFRLNVCASVLSTRRDPERTLGASHTPYFDWHALELLAQPEHYSIHGFALHSKITRWTASELHQSI